MSGSEKMREVQILNAEKKRVCNAIKAISKTQEGEVFFQWLSKHCFFLTPSIMRDGSIDTNRMIQEDALRKLYLKIRPCLSEENRNRIEKGEIDG